MSKTHSLWCERVKILVPCRGGKTTNHDSMIVCDSNATPPALSTRAPTSRRATTARASHAARAPHAARHAHGDDRRARAPPHVAPRPVVHRERRARVADRAIGGARADAPRDARAQARARHARRERVRKRIVRADRARRARCDRGEAVQPDSRQGDRAALASHRRLLRRVWMRHQGETKLDSHGKEEWWEAWVLGVGARRSERRRSDRDSLGARRNRRGRGRASIANLNT